MLAGVFPDMHEPGIPPVVGVLLLLTGLPACDRAPYVVAESAWQYQRRKRQENRNCAISIVIMTFAEPSISAALAGVAAAVFAVCALAVIISLRVPAHLQEIWQVGVP
jgi:hypothetical protein